MIAEIRDAVDRAFWLEGFRDYLSLEAGHSRNTVDAYLRDLRRMGEFALARGVREPGAVTRNHLRDFVYLLKDLGLSAATIRRSVSAIRTYYGFLAGEGRVRNDPSDRLETPRRVPDPGSGGADAGRLTPHRSCSVRAGPAVPSSPCRTPAPVPR